MVASEAPAIRLTGLTKSFGTTTAVDNVDLDIGEGEFFSMLGPSGSGKTTVLRLIAGFEQPTSGSVSTVRAGRHDQGAVRPRRQHRVPGLRAFPAHERARQRRLRPAGARGGARPSDARRRAKRSPRCNWKDSATASPGSSPAGNASGSRWPGPPWSRPKALLLDEPLGALDLKLREQMQVELKQIAAQPRHHLHLRHARPGGGADPQRSHRRVQRTGRIEQLGTPAEIYEQPAVAVRRRLRRDLERVRRRAVRARCSAAAASTPCGPRRSASPASAARRGADRTALAPSPRSIYGGNSTRLIVDLDAGKRITVLEQNDAARGCSRAERGARVSVAMAGQRHRGLATTQRTHSKRMETAMKRYRAGRLPATLAGWRSCRWPCSPDAAPPRPAPARNAEAPTELGDTEGAVSLLAWPGYVEDGSNDPAVDWVSAFEKRDRMQGHQQDLRHLRRGVQPHEDRRLRRRRGLRRRLAASGRRAATSPR